MIFSKFEVYKYAGCERLGQVPNHWNALPCRAIVEQRTAKNEGGTISEYLSLMANIGVIRYEDKGDIGNKKPDDLSKCKIVRKGNLVINSMNYGIGSYGLSQLDGVCSSVYIVLEPILRLVSERFCLRIFEEKEFQAYAQSFGNGILAHRSAISWDDLKNITIGLPPLIEQSQIARFLDHETAKIDALIEQQQRLIELLKEKRQAVISHAVTKGLDPTVPMKDSGVEWLGEVPANWTCCALKYLCTLLKDGTHLPPPRVDDGIPLLSVRNIVCGEFLLRGDDSQISESDYLDLCRSFTPIAGDVLLAIVGATLGKTAVVQPGIGKFHIQRSLAIFRTNPKKLNSDWLNLVFQSTGFQSLLWEFAGFSAQPGIYLGTLSSFSVPVPALKEQERIIAAIRDEVMPLDELMANASMTLQLATERRSALISAAVTGKIDVRNWQPPPSDTQQEKLQELAHG